MENLYKLYQKDKFLEHNAVQLLEVSEGHARAKLEVTEKHLNGVKLVHGAAIFTLAELAFAAASLSYLKSVSAGTLIAEAREECVNPRLANYSVHVTDEKGDIVAVCQGMAYRKKAFLDD